MMYVIIIYNIPEDDVIILTGVLTCLDSWNFKQQSSNASVHKEIVNCKSKDPVRNRAILVDNM